MSVCLCLTVSVYICIYIYVYANEMKFRKIYPKIKCLNLILFAFHYSYIFRKNKWSSLYIEKNIKSGLGK